MAVISRRSLIRRLPLSAWVAVTWCAGTAYPFRGYAALDFMPHFARYLRWSWLLLALATVVALGACRLLPRRPLLALGLLAAGSIGAGLAIRWPNLPVLHFVAIDIVLGFIVATAPRRTWVAAFTVALAVPPVYRLAQWMPVVHLSLAYEFTGTGGWRGLLVLSLMAVAGLVGNSVRQARQYAQRLSARTAAAAVTGERLRISRELHDMVAHSIGIIALQAGAAARVIDSQPDGARQAMIAVETTSRETLSGLRRLLGALREGELGTEPVPLQPAPGLTDVGRLAAATTAAGVRVDVHWHGERRPLPPDIDQSAYRIIQESVTNVVRHAGSPSCKVYITYLDGELSIEVTDRGQGGAGDAGFGLAGMRERVALLHGEFTAGPRPDGGFRVLARLPVPQPARAR